MRTIAVIIKHPGRYNDWRIDMYSVPDETTHDQVKAYAEEKMLGSFEVVAISEQVSAERTLQTKLVEVK